MSLTDPLIGKRLGDYLIEGVLGTGGMARVYRGYDDNLDRYAAIKVIEPQLIASAEEDEYRERFLREARAIARLSHPRIVGVYQFNQVGNLYYIAMEYIEGRNLRDILKSYIKQDKLIPTTDLLKILRDIGESLDYAHQQSIIHRDIKPSNIIVTDEGNAVLTDFGLALNAVEGTIGNTFGSVHYIAPEQAISSAQAVPQSDQYSLGIVAYELLTGRVPFDDASAMSVALKHISDPPPPPTELNPNIPAEVEEAVLKALDKDVSRRYPTCVEFINALDMAFSMVENQDVAPPPDLPSGPPAETSPVPPPKLRKDSSQDSLKTQVADAVEGSQTSLPKSGTVSPLVSIGGMSQRNMILGALVIIIGIVVIVGFVMSNIAQQNASATSTAEVEQTATQMMVAQIAEENTATAVQEITVAQETAIAGEATSTAIMGETQTVEALIESQTASAQETQTQDARSTATTIVDEQTETAQAISDMQTEQARPTNTPTPSPTDEPTNTPTIMPTATNTPRPTRTPTPEIFIGEATATDSRQMMLRYDGRLLVIGNRDESAGLDISDLVFVRFERNEEGEFEQTDRLSVGTTFGSQAINLRPGRCLQILDTSEFLGLPNENPLAEELCAGNPFWVTTTHIFWVSESTDSYFEVRLGPVDLLATCPINTPLTRRELRCAVNIHLP